MIGACGGKESVIMIAKASNTTFGDII